MPSRATPIRGRGANTVRFLDRFAGGSGQSITWASCQNSRSGGFKDEPNASFTRGFYLSNSDLGLIGLAALAISPAIAFTGPTWAIFTYQGGYAHGLLAATNTSIGNALLGSSIAGLLSGFIPARGAEFTNFARPCSDDRRAAF
jgi:hypothetical protein